MVLAFRCNEDVLDDDLIWDGLPLVLSVFPHYMPNPNDPDHLIKALQVAFQIRVIARNHAAKRPPKRWFMRSLTP